ncbi:RNA polymerase sigma factor [Pseudonocardia sp. Cha107L01]|uniref:RNA polymerase sigma factor n=1 Tax=Pseudonocardia sp. Cha107L01 TaxID=3457576 RepID=UPI00403EA567
MRFLAEPRRQFVRVQGVDSTGSGLSDDALLAGLGTGTSQLARAFVGRFQRAVLGVAYKVVGDRGLAEDIAQQAFEHAWRHAETYDPRRGSVRTWLIRITHNLAIDVVRARRSAPIDPHDLYEFLPPISHTPEHDTLAEEESTELRAALAAIPEGQARAVIMASIHAMTAYEIAQIEHIPLGTAKYRIRAGLIKLHTVLPVPRDDYA